jgi:hypothetical protein
VTTDGTDDADGVELALKMAGGLAIAALSAKDPQLALLAGTAWPALEVGAERFASGFRHRAAATLGVAAKAAGFTPGEFVDRIANDPKKLQLLASAVDAARTSGWEARVRVIGAALASGALTDDPALVDEENRWIEILANVEPADLRIVNHLLREDPERPGHMILARRETLAGVSGYQQLLGRALTLLERDTLVRRQLGSELGAADRGRWAFSATTEVFSRGELAKVCHERFLAAGVEVSPTG